MDVCPWRGFTDLDVVEVIKADRAVGPEGSPVMLLYDDPPNRIYEGLLYYRMIRDRIQIEVQQKRLKKHQQQRRSR